MTGRMVLLFQDLVVACGILEQRQSGLYFQIFAE